MANAIGMIEYKTVASGMTAADLMVKTSEVEVIEAKTVCPGKYMVLVTGDLSSVKAAVDATTAKFPDTLIDSFVLGNPHESIMGAIYGANEIHNKNALGILETYTAASAIVELIELRLARGMCGKSYLLITGEVAAVQMAIEKAKADIGEDGTYLDSSVIASPDAKLWDSIL